MSKSGTCRSCGKPIYWIKMKSGKMMSCDTEPVTFRIDKENHTGA